MGGMGRGVGRLPRPRRFGRRWLWTSIALIAAVLVLGSALALWVAITTIAPRTQPGDLVALLRPDGDGPGTWALKVRHQQRINVLVLGYGGPGHGGPYLTDSMLLLSIGPAGSRTVMVSIPRDLLVNIPALPGDGSIPGRINLAYAIGVDRRSFPDVRNAWTGPTGGGDLAAATVTQVLGQPIDYWIAFDFAAFRDVVDALGGIPITLPAALDDPYLSLIHI